MWGYASCNRSAVNIADNQMVKTVNYRGVPSKMVRLGLTQIDLIIQILLFPLRVPRFLRETPLPLADAADGAERLGQTRHRVKNLEDRTRICLRGWVCNRAAVVRGGERSAFPT